MPSTQLGPKMTTGVLGDENVKQVPRVRIWSLGKFCRCPAGPRQFSSSNMDHVIKGEGAASRTQAKTGPVRPTEGNGVKRNSV